ncbi:unnamed protein product [Phytophthora lilii]|uniref:Unnamed protein product n=1 Tax=Phytophthora lilii TaxID=2077276 RepID=A0A9W6TLQ5_9STRA|nr:unnamed protein product [Phytophthora lilii]
MALNDNDGGNVETEGEGGQEKHENPENVVDEQEVAVHSDRRSSLEKYTSVAKHAVKMVIDNDHDETIEAVRRIVEVNGLDANRRFLERLGDGEVDKEVAVAFADVRTSY